MITLNYSRSKIDIEKAWQRHALERWRRGYKSILASILFVWLFGIVTWIWEGPTLLVIISPAFLALVGILFALDLFWAPRMIGRKVLTKKRETHLRVSEDQFCWEHEGQWAAVNWDRIEKLIVDEWNYLIYWDEKQFTAVPASAFTDDAARSEWEKLLSAKIGKVEWRGKRR